MGAGHGSSMNSGVAMGGPTQITLKTNGGIISRNNSFGGHRFQSLGNGGM